MAAPLQVVQHTTEVGPSLAPGTYDMHLLSATVRQGRQNGPEASTLSSKQTSRDQRRPRHARQPLDGSGKAADCLSNVVGRELSSPT